VVDNVFDLVEDAVAVELTVDDDDEVVVIEV